MAPRRLTIKDWKEKIGRSPGLYGIQVLHKEAEKQMLPRLPTAYVSDYIDAICGEI